MLRDVVVHITNEQPILADLLAEPKPSDASLICSNLRTMGGKKPVFIDKTDSMFILPMAHVRFVEIPQTSIAASDAERALEVKLEVKQAPAAPVEDDYPAVPLARLAWLTGEAGAQPPPPEETLPAKVDDPEESPTTPPTQDEIDRDLMRRIHEI